MTLCEVPRTQAELMREIGLSHRTFFRRKRLAPLLRAGLIRRTRPDEPNHPNQAYVVRRWKSPCGCSIAQSARSVSSVSTANVT